MHKTLQTALDMAEEVMLEMTSSETVPAAERARLEKMTKAQLIDLLVKPKKKDVKVEDMVYALMCTPECAALSYAMIASIIVKHRPGKTNEGNIRWYASKAIEKGQDTVPRIVQKELNRMILESVGQ